MQIRHMLPHRGALRRVVFYFLIHQRHLIPRVIFGHKPPPPHREHQPQVPQRSGTRKDRSERWRRAPIPQLGSLYVTILTSTEAIREGTTPAPHLPPRPGDAYTAPSPQSRIRACHLRESGVDRCHGRSDRARQPGTHARPAAGGVSRRAWPDPTDQGARLVTRCDVTASDVPTGTPLALVAHSIIEFGH